MIYSGKSIHIHRIEVNPFQENTYVLVADRKAWIVDPGFFQASEFNIFLDILEQEHAEAAGILLTHAHIDHILGVERLVSQFPGIGVTMHPLEQFNWDKASMTAAWFGLPFTPPSVIPEYFTGPRFKRGSLNLEIRHVPGHSPGHVVFIPEGEFVALCGDTVFFRSIGRTDLPGGNPKQLLEAIKGQLFTLPDEIELLPGHGPKTLVGDERRENPYAGEQSGY
jgi:glyoxylase-like metal-dependent hydrolase (beta-lactamase superfamily II)